MLYIQQFIVNYIDEKCSVIILQGVSKWKWNNFYKVSQNKNKTFVFIYIYVMFIDFSAPKDNDSLNIYVSVYRFKSL